MNEEKIMVEACEGRVVPLHRSDAPTGGHELIAHGDEPIEVPNSVGIRRRIRSGDLRIVERKAPASNTTEAASEAMAPPHLDTLSSK